MVQRRAAAPARRRARRSSESSSCWRGPARSPREGRLAESHADLLESIALAPADAVGLRVQLATTCAGVERLLGRHEEAHARLVAGLDQLPDRAAPDAIALMIELAIDGLFRADPESVLRLVDARARGRRANWASAR